MKSIKYCIHKGYNDIVMADIHLDDAYKVTARLDGNHFILPDHQKHLQSDAIDKMLFELTDYYNHNGNLLDVRLENNGHVEFESSLTKESINEDSGNS